jgi:RNA polymerase sigma factor (sigma-70 family)
MNNINDFEPLIKSMARNVYLSSMVLDWSDLCQVGRMAAIKAIKAYDPTAGASLKSFICTAVKQAMYRESAKFISCFTVSPATTRLAAKVNRASARGKTDLEIAEQFNEKESCVRDLRFLYSKRQDSFEEVERENYDTELAINDLVSSIVFNDIEQIIWQERIVGDTEVKDLATRLNLTPAKIYLLEQKLKTRIQEVLQA